MVCINSRRDGRNGGEKGEEVGCLGRNVQECAQCDQNL